MPNATTHIKLDDCRKCRRLAYQLKRLRESHPDYWNRPVPASGNRRASILIVGLAPGMHGANKTGQPFIGDASGELLYQTLGELSIAKQVRITNAVKCLPIKNLPNGAEVKNCARFLQGELIEHTALRGAVTLALGGVAHRAVISALGLKQAEYPFGHGATHELDHVSGQLTLVDSYHCSRYNTQTGRLTGDMFLDVMRKARDIAYP